MQLGSLTRDYQEQIPRVVRAGLEPGIPGSQGKRPDHWATLPLVIDPKDKLVNAYVLKRFYAEARKKNGELYTKASLVGIRFENFEILQLC